MSHGSTDGYTVQPNGSVVLEVGDVEGFAHEIHLTRAMLREIIAASDSARRNFDSEAFYLADEGRGYVTVLDRAGNPVKRNMPRYDAAACYTDS